MKLVTAQSQSPRLHGEFSAVLLRFAWKEQRALRSLAMSVIVAATGLVLLAIWLAPSSSFDQSRLAIAWGSGAFFAVGAATSLFGAERDERTDEFLVLLPRNAYATLAGKAIAATTMALGVVLLITLLGFLLAGGRLPELQLSAAASRRGLLVMAEWFVWGIAVSLLCPHPLLAPVVAIAAASLGAEFAYAATGANESSVWLAKDIAAAQRLLIVGVVAFVATRLAVRWLDRAPTVARTQRSGLARRVEHSPESVAALHYSPVLFPVVRRLVWQSGREGRLPLLAVVPVGIFFTASFSAVADGLAKLTGGASFASLSWLSVPALCGAVAFRADQRGRQCAFLHAHAVSSGAIWAARNAVALAVALVAAIPLELLLLRGTPLGWASIFAAYGCGQLCSLQIRSHVVSGFSAVGFSMVVAAWSTAAEMWQLPALWFVAAIGVASLGASYAGCRGWLADAQGIKRWAPSAEVAAVALAALAVSWPATRRAQVAFARPTSKPTTLATTLTRWEAERPAAEAVAAQYQRVIGHLQTTSTRLSDDLDDSAKQAAFLVASQGDFDELLHICEAPRCRLPAASAALGPRRAFVTTLAWLDADASRHIAAGDLDLALDRLITARRMAAHAAQYQPTARLSDDEDRAASARREQLLARWAQESGQSIERLGSAIQRLIACEELEPAFADAVVADNLLIRERLLSGHAGRLDNAGSVAERAASPWFAYFAALAHRLPGEQARALAALDHLTEARLAYATAVDRVQSSTFESESPSSRVDELKRLLHPSLDRSAGLSRTPRAFGEQSSAEAAALSDELIAASETSFLTALELASRGSVVDAMTATQDRNARRRAEIVRVALIAYRREHGAYPDSLAALTVRRGDREAFVSTSAILDPYASAPFQYRPHGLALPLQRFNEAALAELLAPGTPHLWSVGATYVRPAENWVIEARTQEGGVSLIFADHPGPSSSVPFDDVPVRIAKFHSGVDYFSRGPILLVLPE